MFYLHFFLCTKTSPLKNRNNMTLIVPFPCQQRLCEHDSDMLAVNQELFRCSFRDNKYQIYHLRNTVAYSGRSIISRWAPTLDIFFQNFQQKPRKLKKKLVPP